ncbi:MAG: hypothetical protein J6386_15660 [Candidatus Synoicihabitans palmerolidicus]|nr:hypothetical protein [Candidatus Synoicihabitans palmerolidicus]
MASAEKAVLVVGLISSAIITLWDPGSSRMYAFPGDSFYWIALLVPPLGLSLHVLGNARYTLPLRAWLWALVALLISAVLSPYRSVALLWSAT